MRGGLVEALQRVHGRCRKSTLQRVFLLFSGSNCREKPKPRIGLCRNAEGSDDCIENDRRSLSTSRTDILPRNGRGRCVEGRDATATRVTTISKNRWVTLAGTRASARSVARNASSKSLSDRSDAGRTRTRSGSSWPSRIDARGRSKRVTGTPREGDPETPRVRIFCPTHRLFVLPCFWKEGSTGVGPYGVRTDVPTSPTRVRHAGICSHRTRTCLVSIL